MTTRAIIPARIGSKGVTRKNLRKVGDLTLIERTILTALQSNIFSEIIVTSDSQEILEISKSLGAIPVKRANELSQDTSKARDVVGSILEMLGQTTQSSDMFFYLQPTSPFTKPATIIELRDLLQAQHIPVFTARESDPVQKIFQLGTSMEAEQILDFANPTGNRQEFIKTYIATGGCYAFQKDHFLEWNDIPVLGARPYFVEWPEYVDIDSEENLFEANVIAKVEGILNANR